MQLSVQLSSVVVSINADAYFDVDVDVDADVVADVDDGTGTTSTTDTNNMPLCIHAHLHITPSLTKEVTVNNPLFAKILASIIVVWYVYGKWYEPYGIFQSHCAFYIWFDRSSIFFLPSFSEYCDLIWYDICSSSHNSFLPRIKTFFSPKAEFIVLYRPSFWLLLW